jgi:hypothetical protein
MPPGTPQCIKNHNKQTGFCNLLFPGGGAPSLHKRQSAALAHAWQSAGQAYTWRRLHNDQNPQHIIQRSCKLSHQIGSDPNRARSSPHGWPFLTHVGLAFASHARASEWDFTHPPWSTQACRHEHQLAATRKVTAEPPWCSTLYHYTTDPRQATM